MISTRLHDSTTFIHAYLKRKLVGLEGEGLEREGEPEGRGVGEGESHTPHIIKAEKSRKTLTQKLPIFFVFSMEPPYAFC